MARIAIAAQQLEGNQIGASGLLVTQTACQATGSGGNSTPWTGRELLVFYNSSTDTPYDVLISSVPDAQGRSGDITQELDFGKLCMFGPGGAFVEGWRQTDGNLYFSVENAAIKVMIFKLPANG